MNLKFRFMSLRRRSLILLAIVVLSLAMLPTVAFAQYGTQGRAYNPGPPPQSSHNQPPYNQPPHNQPPQNQPPQNQPPQNQPPHNQPPQNPPNDQNDNCCETVYTVQDGDTLSEIAQHFHVSQQELAAANGINNPNYIYVGQQICIPE